MKAKCKHCGKSFITNHSGQKFCGVTCYQLHVREAMEKLRNETSKEGKPNAQMP